MAYEELEEPSHQAAVVICQWMLNHSPKSSLISVTIK